MKRSSLVGLIILLQFVLLKRLVIRPVQDLTSHLANAVSETIHRVATSARETETGAEQVMAATGELLDTAKSLESMVEQFHLTELPEDYAA
jgi:hypothetical protein